MRLVLIVDPTVSGIGMAFGDIDSEMLHTEIAVERNGSARLMSEYLTVGLKHLNAKISDIAMILCATGPGSFTGIKVGIAWVQGLQAGLGDTVVVKPYSSLESASKFLKQTKNLETVGVILPITRTHGFLVLNKDQQIQTRLIEIKSESGRQQIKSLAGSNIFVGNHWQELENLLTSTEIKFQQLSSLDLIKASLQNIYTEVADLFGNDNLNNSLIPNYMRVSTAEERLIKGEK